MTRDEILDHIDILGLTVTRLASFLGVSERAVWYWLTEGPSHREIPPPAAQHLRLCVWLAEEHPRVWRDWMLSQQGDDG